jgi:hypothetical protein
MPRIEDSEQFTMLGSLRRDNVFGDYCEQCSAKTYNQMWASPPPPPHHHPDTTLTITPTSPADLLGLAAAGNVLR